LRLVTGSVPGWQGEIDLPRTSLPALSDEFCAVRALLRFARAPWLVADNDGWIVGDLRYDREPGLGFAEVHVGPHQDECPRHVPDWTPPRADLLGTSHSAGSIGTAFSQNSAPKH
jgi:inner membrane protein